jgi:hypothetical protein
MVTGGLTAAERVVVLIGFLGTAVLPASDIEPAH